MLVSTVYITQKNYKSEFGESKRRLTKRFASIEEMSAINISNISGAPNENIVQNHLNIALLNVF